MRYKNIVKIPWLWRHAMICTKMMWLRRKTTTILYAEAVNNKNMELNENSYKHIFLGQLVRDVYVIIILQETSI